MIQYSLDRLLEGMAATLTGTVAPATSDPYARAQAMAAAEILSNLRTRITWDHEYALGWVARVREALRSLLERASGISGVEEIDAALSCDEPTSRTPVRDVEEFVRLHATALAVAERWLSDAGDGFADIADSVARVASDQLDDELRRLRR